LTAIETVAKNRKVSIMADAAYVILRQPANLYYGQFAIDEVFLRFQGVTDFSKYKQDPDCKDDELTMDFFLPPNPYSNAMPTPVIVQQISKAKL
jgi:citronellol/citronellal dehydrogenase